MQKVIQLSLEEFSEEINKKYDWENLPVGTIYLDKDHTGSWVAVEVLGKDLSGECVLKTYPLQIV